MGRPPKDIDKESFEGLLAIQCTLDEVTAFFDHKLGGCSEDTIERWCKRTYNTSFAEISAQKRMLGRISLRRLQYKLAEHSAAMAIFLGKNYLSQSDSVTVSAPRTESTIERIAKMMMENNNDNDANQ